MLLMLFLGLLIMPITFIGMSGYDATSTVLGETTSRTYKVRSVPINTVPYTDEVMESTESTPAIDFDTVSQ